MTLDYIWIDDFRVLKDVGLNFSSKYIFNYSKQTGILEIAKNELFIENFFGNNISELTAIIGENGTGKSTLLEFIIRNITGISSQGITTHEDGNFIAILSNIIVVKGDLEITNKIDIEQLGFKFIDYNNGNLFYHLTGTGFENLSFIYYSNVFDYKEFSDLPCGEINISTNHLFIEDSKDYIGDKVAISPHLFVDSELKREIDFLSEVDFIPPFKLPDKLIIEVSKNVHHEKNIIPLGEGDDTYGLLIKGFPIQKLNFSNKELSLKFLIFSNLLRYCCYTNSSLYDTFPKEILYDIFFDNFSDINLLSDEIQKELNLFQNVVASFADFLNKASIEIEDKQDYFLIHYELGEDNQSLFNFIRSINKIMGIDTFMHFSWLGISSGEKAFLSLFGRMNNAKKRIDETDYENKSLIIMIDECDLYFHPQWQKNLISILLKTLPEIFKKKDIQLILTSHSPLLISDIPNSNIIFLKKEYENPQNINGPFKCKVVDKFSRLTFGANIHSLFKESFFLENGTMGEFAKQQIQDVILFLKYNHEKKSSKANRKPNKKWSKEEVESFIQVIGEPLIKERLQKLFDDKYHTKEDIERRIALLQDQLKKLPK